jgi:hypothetical protein
LLRADGFTATRLLAATHLFEAGLLATGDYSGNSRVAELFGLEAGR